MAVLNPDHLFEQAERLIAPVTRGAARQADLRRAISAAYYGVFHTILTAAADEFIGVTKRTTRRYVLVYRSVDHGSLRDLCMETKKPQPSPRHLKYAPIGGFGPDMRAFARAFLELREERNLADYDPSERVRTLDARVAVASARTAVGRFAAAGESERQAFLTLLLFPPR